MGKRTMAKARVRSLKIKAGGIKKEQVEIVRAWIEEENSREEDLPIRHRPLLEWVKAMEGKVKKARIRALKIQTRNKREEHLQIVMARSRAPPIEEGNKIEEDPPSLSPSVRKTMPVEAMEVVDLWNGGKASIRWEDLEIVKSNNSRAPLIQKGNKREGDLPRKVRKTMPVEALEVVDLWRREKAIRVSKIRAEKREMVRAMEVQKGNKRRRDLPRTVRKTMPGKALEAVDLWKKKQASIRAIAEERAEERDLVQAMEVLSVRIHNDENQPREIYGTVTVVCGSYSADIFKRSERECQLIAPAGYSDLLLSAPHGPIPFDDKVSFVLALKDRLRDSSSYNYPPIHKCCPHCYCVPDAPRGFYTKLETNELSCVCDPKVTILHWRPYRLPSSQLNIPRTARTIDETVGTDYWTAKVDFAPFKAVVRADFEVTLIINNHNHQNFYDVNVAAHVCGRITAGILLPSSPEESAECVLFQKGAEISKSDMSVKISHGEHLGLLKSFVVLPSSSSLTVLADLRDGDLQMVKGTVVFPVRLDYPCEGTISGKCGKMIRVKVTFTEIESESLEWDDDGVHDHDPEEGCTQNCR